MWGFDGLEKLFYAACVAVAVIVVCCLAGWVVAITT